MLSATLRPNTSCSTARRHPAARVRCRILVRRPPPPPPPTNFSKPYTPGSTPADLAMTTTTTGLTVPYVVRVERGTLNRGIYDIAVLFDTTQAQPWTPLAP